MCVFVLSDSLWLLLQSSATCSKQFQQWRQSHHIPAGWFMLRRFSRDFGDRVVGAWVLLFASLCVYNMFIFWNHFDTILTWNWNTPMPTKASVSTHSAPWYLGLKLSKNSMTWQRVIGLWFVGVMRLICFLVVLVAFDVNVLDVSVGCVDSAVGILTYFISQFINQPTFEFWPLVLVLVLFSKYMYV